MWVSVELWDNEAKAQFSNIQKGQKLNGIGYLIFNKWTDKNSGEERKQFRLRLTKIVSDELMKGLLEPIEEVSGSDNGIDDSWQADSNFSGEFLDEMGNKSDSNGNRFDSTNEKDGSASFNDESPVIKNPFEKLWFRRPATTTNKATKSDEWNINGEESQYW